MLDVIYQEREFRPEQPHGLVEPLECRGEPVARIREVPRADDRDSHHAERQDDHQRRDLERPANEASRAEGPALSRVGEILGVVGCPGEHPTGLLSLAHASCGTGNLSGKACSFGKLPATARAGSSGRDQAARASVSAIVDPIEEGLGATAIPAADRISTFSCALSPKAR